MSKLLPEGTYVGYPLGGAPLGPLAPLQGSPSVLEVWKKNAEYPKKIYKNCTC